MSKTIAQLERDLADAQMKSTRACEARGALPMGSSRARITTANARWASAAEERDRCQERLDRARQELAASEVPQ